MVLTNDTLDVVEWTLGWSKGFRRPRYSVDRPAASFLARDDLEIMVLGGRRVVNDALWRGPA
ncbi:MAG TPA: hypothetical protein VMY34_01275, partial [Acidimicrobiales bacterium]|nr:hypothetical protein [Acidimicrobiales bacterium]